MTAAVQEQSFEVLTKLATETYTGSVLLMKQLTTIAISAVTYCKTAFDEENFKTENVNGLRMKILKKNCKDELAQFVSTSLSQAFDAFDKKYLQKLALCFYKDEASEADNLVQYIAFEYSYTQTGVRMDVSSKSRGGGGAQSQYTFEHVRDAMRQMIQRCLTMTEIQYQLPEIYDISLRLYYNDAAPEGYQPPGFLPVSETDDHLELSVMRNGRPLQVGCVQTPFHRLVARSYAREVLPSSNDAELKGSLDLRKYLTYSCSSICGFLQHGACFGRVSAPRRHACTLCGPAPGADLRLMQLNDRKRESLCMLRRSMCFCARLTCLDMCALQDQFHVSKPQAEKLMTLLVSLGVLEDSELSIMRPRKIVREQLIAQMRMLFYLEESELVDLLEAEGLSEQAPAQRDPVGAVLGPLERASLQDATVLGKMIEPPTHRVVEDETLQQYNEAIRSSQKMDEDLPLSGNHNPVQDMNCFGRKTRKRVCGKENKNDICVKTKRNKAK